ncbi:hypothetical protein D3C81_1749840 [compost metagenome]
MVFGKTHGANVALVDRQPHVGTTNRLAPVIENDLASGGQHEGDLILWCGQGDAEIPAILHAPHAHAFKAPIHAANADALGQRRHVGIQVAEHLCEQSTKVIAAHVARVEDEGLAVHAGMHCRFACAKGDPDAAMPA